VVTASALAASTLTADPQNDLAGTEVASDGRSACILIFAN
jgi:hypothetical protein